MLANTFDFFTVLQTMHCNAFFATAPICIALLLWSSAVGAAAATAAAADDGVRDASRLGMWRPSGEVSDLKRGHPDMNSLVFGRRSHSTTRKRNNHNDDDDDLDGICQSVVAFCSKLHSSDTWLQK